MLNNNQQFFLLCIVTIVTIVGQENFVLIGPPGGGKGTFSSYMTKQHNYRQICPGDILREHIKNNTELGKVIKPILERGDDIDCTVVYKIIDSEVTSCLERKIPFIIDGFPRNAHTFEFLKKFLKEKSASSLITFIHFKIDNQTCLERINNRLVCTYCGSIFNKTTNKPKKEALCDCCNKELQIRIGDETEITVKRLNAYRKNIEPLTEFAKKDFKLYTIDAHTPLVDCIKMYESLLKH
jgi:adenylate kinase